MSGKLFFQGQGLVRELVNCQGNLELLVNVRELSGNFENTRFQVKSLRNLPTSHQCFWAVLNHIVSRSVFDV